MAIRTIIYNIADDLSLTPNTIQYGGVQGEHNATELEFIFSDSSMVEGYMFRAEAVTADGELDGCDLAFTKTQNQDCTCVWRAYCLIPLAWTQYGGVTSIRLVAEKDDEVAYTVEIQLRFADRQSAMEKVDTLLRTNMRSAIDACRSAADEVEQAVQRSKDNADTAYNHAIDAAEKADDAQGYARSAWENGEFANQCADRAEAAASAAETDGRNAANYADEAEKAEQAAKGHSNDAFGYTVAALERAELAQECADRAEAAASAAGEVAHRTSNALIGNVQGGAVSMADVSPIAHELGVKVSSKNLLAQPYKHSTRIALGVNWVLNEDGTINATTDANGATGISTFLIYGNGTGTQAWVRPECLKIGETYTLSTKENLPSGVTLVCNFYEAATGASSIYAQLTSDKRSAKLTISDKCDLIYIYLRVPTGTVLDNVHICPMIEKGTTATAYTPYTDVTSHSKNLLDESEGMSEVSFNNGNGVNSQTARGYALTLSAGTYTISGERYSNKEYSYYDGRFWIKAYTNDAQGNYTNELYLFTGTDYAEDHGWIRTNTITVGEGEKLFIVNTNDGDLQTDFHIQVEKGAVATAYEPYKEIGAVVSQYGKNLLNESNGAGDIVFYNAQGVAQHKVGYMFPLPVGSYIISGTLKGGSSDCNISIGINDKDNKVGTVANYRFVYDGKAQNLTFNINEGDKLIVYCGKASTGKTEKESVDDFNIQVELGDTATPYEPYNLIDTATVNADGTVDGLVSHYPSTTLLTDMDGSIIECEYNKDLNKAYDALMQAIISLGGTV